MVEPRQAPRIKKNYKNLYCREVSPLWPWFGYSGSSRSGGPPAGVPVRKGMKLLALCRYSFSQIYRQVRNPVPTKKLLSKTRQGGRNVDNSDCPVPSKKRSPRSAINVAPSEASMEENRCRPRQAPRFLPNPIFSFFTPSLALLPKLLSFLRTTHKHPLTKLLFLALFKAFPIWSAFCFHPRIITQKKKWRV